LLVLALVLSWMWDRVVTNCKGGPEQTSYYYFQATIRLEVWSQCRTGTGKVTVPCLVQSYARPIPFGPQIPDPRTGTTVFTWFDPVDDPTVLPTPPLGGVSAWPWPCADNRNPVVAVDASGNRCFQVCSGTSNDDDEGSRSWQGR
jgi:hypothetical protein